MAHKRFIITGHPYAFPYYFKVFEYLENKNDFIFILPRIWLAKKGKVKIKLEKRAGLLIYGLEALSFGGKSIPGLFKGWMPGIALLLPYLKLRYGSRVLYSCAEPNLLTSLYNGIFAKIFGFKHVLFTWQNLPPEKWMSGVKLRIYLTILKLNLALSDGIICGNRKAAEIIQGFKVQGSGFKILVCPIAGVDIEKFRPGIRSDWKQKLNLSENEKLILFYGALDKRKGLDVLVDAFKILNSQFEIRNSKLLIVGTGPEKSNLELRITDYGLNAKVILRDWMKNEDLPALLNVANVFVYPSAPQRGWEEQFGYAMAEASACGIPVIATRTGSIDEVVADGQTGILVSPNSPDELAGALSNILSDGAPAEKFGKNGRDYVVNNYSHQIIAKKLSDFMSKQTS